MIGRGTDRTQELSCWEGEGTRLQGVREALQVVLLACCNAHILKACRDKTRRAVEGLRSPALRRKQG